MQNDLLMKEFVIDLLKKDIPSNYYYHNYTHTVYVVQKVEEIGRHEKCNSDELRLLKTAALWHDTGFIHTYIDHEEAGCELTRKHLPAYGYTPEEIEMICGMIMATKIPQRPGNKLEEIIADADLEYLGTNAAAAKAEDLFKELQLVRPPLSKKDWNKIQVSFLEQHDYFTDYCKKQGEPGKNVYLKQLIENQLPEG